MFSPFPWRWPKCNCLPALFMGCFNLQFCNQQVKYMLNLIQVSWLPWALQKIQIVWIKYHELFKDCLIAKLHLMSFEESVYCIHKYVCQNFMVLPFFEAYKCILYLWCILTENFGKFQDSLDCLAHWHLSAIPFYSVRRVSGGLQSIAGDLGHDRGQSANQLPSTHTHTLCAIW